MGEQEGREDTPSDYTVTLDRHGFRLQERLGSGASGRVYKAIQKRLERPVAVKFFDGLHSRNRQMEQRFRRESKLLAKIISPHVPYVLTDGETKSQKTLYYVMQFVEGQPLASLLPEPLEEDVAVSYAKQILEALSTAHKAKIIHRDVTPSNVLQRDGYIYLIDFSIGGRIGTTSSTPVTKHERLGRVEYAAPEQQRDASTSDERSDLFSVGVVLFEMLAGHPRHQLEDAKVRTDLRTIIKKACEEDPADRFQSADEFLAALPRFGTTRARRAAPGQAVCLGEGCPGARWGGQGYYKGPRILVEATDNHCRECGGELLYRCRHCGADFEGDRYCGSCGTEFFNIPACEACGSFLKRADLGRDTSEGCSRCMVTYSSGWTASDTTAGNDDDIPF